MESELYYSSDKSKCLLISSINKMNELFGYKRISDYKYDNLLVVGNGFDLNLGLRTTYRDFANSRIFKRMYIKRTQEKLQMGNLFPSLIDFLYGKKYQDKWYDIENALLEYVSRKQDGDFVNNVIEDKKDFQLVCKSLIDYLASFFDGRNNDPNISIKMMESPAGKLLLRLNSHNNIVYSFNYTPIELILCLLGKDQFSDPLNAVRIHGEIKDETIIKKDIKDNIIILGIETNNIRNISPEYSFLIKSNNEAYRSTSIATDLLNSRNVIFFGHSLNEMDFGYFDGYFKMLTCNTDKERKLTVITKDNSSRIKILDNIRKMGISVRDIFAHTDVQFFLTEKLYGDEIESKKFDKLIESI